MEIVDTNEPPVPKLHAHTVLTTPTTGTVAAPQASGIRNNDTAITSTTANSADNINWEGMCQRIINTDDKMEILKLLRELMLSIFPTIASKNNKNKHNTDHHQQEESEYRKHQLP